MIGTIRSLDAKMREDIHDAPPKASPAAAPPQR
jgi:hypothetical protein